MSLADRLFPAAELNALKKYTYQESSSQPGPAKRRRLNSTCSSSSMISTAADSGYNSADDASAKVSQIASQPVSQVGLISSAKPNSAEAANLPARLGNDLVGADKAQGNSQKRRRVNSEPLLSSHTQTNFLQTSIYCMPLSDRPQLAASSPSSIRYPASSANVRDPDLEIVAAQHQIALARQRLHSYSGPVHTTKPDQAHPGWTAGPKAASSTDIFTRLFDGCRIMGNERNLLSSLAASSEQALKTQPAPQVELTADEKKEVEAEVQFAGLAMPAHLDDEDELDYEPGAYHHESESGNGFEDVFKLDEASSPSKRGPGP